MSVFLPRIPATLVLVLYFLTPHAFGSRENVNSMNSNTIRSKPGSGASPESHATKEECSAPQATTSLTDLPTWLKENNLDDFIPKLEKVKLQTLITAYEIDPKMLLLRCMYFSSKNKI